MSYDDLIAELVKEEQANSLDDGYYEDLDQYEIKGCTKRGNNKAALKDVKDLNATSIANSRKSPKKDKPSATPRSAQKMSAGKSGWETKVQISTDRQSPSNYTCQPAVAASKFSESTPSKNSKRARPMTSKTESPKGGLIGGSGERNRKSTPGEIEETPTKKENVKAWSAWDDKDPWA